VPVSLLHLEVPFGAHFSKKFIMLIVDYIAKTLCFPNDSPERYLLRDQCRKVQLGSLIATHGLAFLMSVSLAYELSNGLLKPAMLAGRVLAVTTCTIIGTEITTMGLNLAQNVTSDRV
jgi:hypothetical protein